MTLTCLELVAQTERVCMEGEVIAPRVSHDAGCVDGTRAQICINDREPNPNTERGTREAGTDSLARQVEDAISYV